MLNTAIELGQESMAVAFALKTKTFNHKEKLTGTGEVSYEAYIGTEGYGELNTLVDEIPRRQDCRARNIYYYG